MSTVLKSASVKSTPSKKVSASAGSESDLERVKSELDIPLPRIGKKTPRISKAIKLSVEPLVKVKKMSKEDILLAQKRVRDEYTKLVSSESARKKSAKMNQVKRPVVKIRVDTSTQRYIN